MDVPRAALKVIGQLLGAMGQGQSVVLMPMEREFTTVEAAHFLNVSRPFVIKEMEYGGLAGRVERVGLQWRSCTQQALTEIVLGTGTYPDKAAYPRLDATTGHRDRSGQAG